MRSKESTKVKLSVSAPLLTPTSPPPTTSITCCSSSDPTLASKHSSLVTVSYSTIISAKGFGCNGKCTTDTTSAMFESVSAKGEVTFSGGKLDIRQWKACLLHGGFISMFIYINYYLFASLINWSASNDVSMLFQSDIEERYSSVRLFRILPFFKLFTSYEFQVLLTIFWIHWFNAIPREHQRFSRFLRVDCCLSQFSNHSFNLISWYQYQFIYFIDIHFNCFEIMNNSFNFTDSDIFYVEFSSRELSPRRENTPDMLNHLK